MHYDAKSQWTQFFAKKEPGSKTYPNEYAVRIFMGNYPRLNLDKSLYKRQKACEIGCGDGRNLVLLHNLGFRTYGVEITDEIVHGTKLRLKTVEGVEADIRVGTNDELPFESEFFDYLLSWNACYYMGEQEDFGAYVNEFARVLKPNGHLVVCVPKPNHFIFDGSKSVRPGYRQVQNDPVGIRNGEVLRQFEDEEGVRKELANHFDRFVFGSQDDDCFGEEYHVFLFVCQKKT